MSLAAEELSVRRGGRTVIGGLSAVLREGEITAIVGPNGAGKSSALLALAGLLPPAEGRITLDGAALAVLAPQVRARAIGYLPQQADIAWDVSAERLVALGRLPWGDAGTAEVQAALEALDLQALRHRPVSQLSGGERARVLLARVLAGSPRWILADEPLAALDLAHQLRLIGHLKACAAQGQGVVVVLHNLALAMNHANHVIVLNEGRLAAEGPPAEALSAQTITSVWGIAASWLGEPGRQGLVTGA